MANNNIYKSYLISDLDDFIFNIDGITDRLQSVNKNNFLFNEKKDINIDKNKNNSSSEDSSCFIKQNNFQSNNYQSNNFQSNNNPINNNPINNNPINNNPINNNPINNNNPNNNNLIQSYLINNQNTNYKKRQIPNILNDIENQLKKINDEEDNNNYNNDHTKSEQNIINGMLNDYNNKKNKKKNYKKENDIPQQNQRKYIDPFISPVNDKKTYPQIKVIKKKKVITQYSNKNEEPNIDLNILQNNFEKKVKFDQKQREIEDRTIINNILKDNSSSSNNESIIDSITSYVKYKNSNPPKVNVINKKKYNILRRR